MIRLVRLILDIIELILIVRAFLAWIPVNRNNRLIDLLFRITEPVLSPVRKLIMRTAGQNLPLDFAPVVVLLLVSLLRYIVIEGIILK
jgi:YggT family protein